jgi:hypothetical protein
MPFAKGAGRFRVHPPHLPLLTDEDKDAPVEVVERLPQRITGSDEVADQLVVLQPKPLQPVVRR